MADSFENHSNLPSRAYGFGGNDLLVGGSNVDVFYGQNGEDTLRGNDGNDRLLGGSGDDILEGGRGNDRLYGQHHHDHLFGGPDNDHLYGGGGQDGLHGGLGVDTYDGGKGADRFLQTYQDVEQDFSAEDVHVGFVNGSIMEKHWSDGSKTTFYPGVWTDADILTIDRALGVMAEHTGNNKLMRDYDGTEFVFMRHGVVDNSQASTTFSAYASGSVMAFSNLTFEDEKWLFQTVFHEVGHNWGSAKAMNAGLTGDPESPGPGDFLLSAFRAQSTWINSSYFGIAFPSIYAVSGNGKWSHDKDASFARDYGKFTPGEDFATAWAARFMDVAGVPYQGGSGASAIPNKLLYINQLLLGLSGPETSSPSGGGGTSPMFPSVAKGSATETASGNTTFRVMGSDHADRVSVQYVDSRGNVRRHETDRVRIRVEDEAGIRDSYVATADVDMLQISVGSGDDRVSNSTCLPTLIVGGAGNDLLVGGCGSDTILGGDGNDTIFGRAGNDVLAGEVGNDTLHGNDGADYMEAGEGNDTMFGGAGDDQMYGENGDDTLRGNAGNDILDGGDDTDDIQGDAGRDLLIGGHGRDQITGGASQDILVGGYVSFDPISDGLTSLWDEWTSDHSWIHRARNVLGIHHASFDERLNGDHFLRKGITVHEDGARDELFANFGNSGDQDLLVVEHAFDDWFLLSGDAVI